MNIFITGILWKYYQHEWSRFLHYSRPGNCVFHCDLCLCSVVLWWMWQTETLLYKKFFLQIACKIVVPKFAFITCKFKGFCCKQNTGLWRKMLQRRVSKALRMKSCTSCDLPPFMHAHVVSFDTNRLWLISPKWIIYSYSLRPFESIIGWNKGNFWNTRIGCKSNCVMETRANSVKKFCGCLKNNY